MEPVIKPPPIIEEDVYSPVYVTHTCKNSLLDEKHPDYCNQAFMELDRYKARTYPPTCSYCPDCQAKGFRKRKHRKVTPELLAHLEQIRIRKSGSVT